MEDEKKDLQKNQEQDNTDVTNRPPVDLAHLGIEKEIEAIVQEYLPQVRDWLDLVAMRDPDKAVKLVLEMVEFIQPKKGKAGDIPHNTNIQINLTPARENEDNQSNTINISQKKE